MERADEFQGGFPGLYVLTLRPRPTATAITTHDGNVTFLLDTPKGADGATINTESLIVQGKGTVMVTALDILTLFKEEDIQEGDEVIVKADIEG